MLRAMIVDDEAPARSELRFLLEQTGKIGTITEASSVRSAIEMLMESRVDVVFLDVFDFHKHYMFGEKFQQRKRFLLEKHQPSP